MNTKQIETVEDEDFFEEHSSHEVVKIFTTENRSCKYDIYLDDDFDTPTADYRELLHKLGKMSVNDQVIIHLASFGGSCHVGFQVCHAVKSCKAQTKIIVEQPCYSMGAILSCCAKSLEMKPFTFLMFHNYSGGSRGKGAEMMQAVEQQNNWLHKSFKHFASPFLYPFELKRLYNDADVYVWEDDESNTKFGEILGIKNPEKLVLSERMKRHFK